MPESSLQTRNILQNLLGSSNINNQAVTRIVIETLTDYITNVKFNRITQFSQKLDQLLANITEEEKQFLQTEDFAQFFELMLRKVAETKSKEKIEILREILKKNIKERQINDFSETFLNLVSQLSVQQFIILKELAPLNDSFIELNSELTEITSKIETSSKLLLQEAKLKEDGLANSYDLIYNHYNTALSRKNEIEFESKRLATINSASNYNLSVEDYEFYIRDLISKNLLYDSGIGFMSYVPLTSLSITAFGKKFLEFIKG